MRVIIKIGGEAFSLSGVSGLDVLPSVGDFVRTGRCTNGQMDGYLGGFLVRRDFIVSPPGFSTDTRIELILRPPTEAERMEMLRQDTEAARMPEVQRRRRSKPA